MSRLANAPTLLVYCLGNWSNDPRVMRSVEAAVASGYNVSIVQSGLRHIDTTPPMHTKVRLIQPEGRWTARRLAQLRELVRTEAGRHRVMIQLFVVSSLVATGIGALLLALLRRIGIGSELLLGASLATLSLTLLAASFRKIRKLLFYEGVSQVSQYYARVFALERRLNLRALAGVITRVRPDVLYVHDLEPLRDLIEIRNSIPESAYIVWDAHEYYPDLVSLGVSYSDRAVRVLNEAQDFLDAFVVVNEMIGSLYLERFPGLPNMVPVYNSARWEGITHYDGRLHEAAGLDRNVRILLFQGGLTQNRGVEFLLALSELLPAEWCVVFMGEGHLEKKIRESADGPRRSGSLSPRLLRPAPHAELTKWTAGATLGALFYEPTVMNHHLASPNKLWEYAAAGVPLLCYDNHWMKSIVREHGIGWSLEFPQSVREVADLVVGLGSHDLSRVRANCLRFIESWNWETDRERLSATLGAIRQEFSG